MIVRLLARIVPGLVILVIVIAAEVAYRRDEAAILEERLRHW